MCASAQPNATFVDSEVLRMGIVGNSWAIQTDSGINHYFPVKMPMVSMATSMHRPSYPGRR
jgi:hypothetical protein